MKGWDLVWFYICVNLSAFILISSGVTPVSHELFADPSSFTVRFNLSTFSIFTSFLAGGIAAGLIGIFTGQYAFAAGGFVIWVVLTLLEPFSWLLTGIPSIMNALGAPIYVSTVVSTIFGVAFFFFFIELVTQRNITS